MLMRMLKGRLKTQVLDPDPTVLLYAASLSGDLPARQWSYQQRLLALNESHRLSGPEPHAWCREKGLLKHQLIPWSATLCAAARPTPANALQQRQASRTLRELQSRHYKLKQELHRKDCALAEAQASCRGILKRGGSWAKT